MFMSNCASKQWYFPVYRNIRFNCFRVAILISCCIVILANDNRLTVRSIISLFYRGYYVTIIFSFSHLFLFPFLLLLFFSFSFSPFFSFSFLLFYLFPFISLFYNYTYCLKKCFAKVFSVSLPLFQ